jgi:serine protease Do
MLPRPRPWQAGLLAGVALGAGVLAWRSNREPNDDPARIRESRRNAIVRAVERTRRSVVTIRVEGRRREPSRADDLLWFPFAPGRSSAVQWVGSGFFLDADGHILTNEHVVRDAKRILVSVGDQRGGMSLPAERVGVAPQYDLALLRVEHPGTGGPLGDDGDPFVPATLGTSEDLMVGEWAIAIGSPFGSELGSVDPSVSLGVISAVQRDLPAPDPRFGPGPYLEMIQTDAAIDEGNSGGPLVNANGEVIGVNAVDFQSVRAGSTGLHFAIPIDTARWVASELLQYGEVRTPWIGWVLEEVAPDVRARLELPEEEGVLRIIQVVRDSPAELAGIRPGDTLLSIRGFDPYSRARAARILFGTRVGADVEVELLRDGQVVRSVVHVIEDPYTKAEREARSRRPLG